MNDKCPICGGPLFDQKLKWYPGAKTLVGENHGVVFTKLEARFFDLLWRARSTGESLDREAIIEYVWRHKGDGAGPNSSVSLSILAAQIRKKLEPFKLNISATGGYRLIGR